MNRVRVLVLLGLVALFAFAVALTLSDGRKGYMPLDHSIVWSGAWRIYCGQVPYRDFTTPNGLLAMYVQAPFFAVFGPTWFAYVLHAALANGVFALLAYSLLRRFALARPFAFVYAAASAIVFYPPIGVPYMEQEGFLCLLASITAAAWASEAQPGSRRATLLWCAASFALALGGIAKQTPAVYAVPVVLAMLLCAARAPRKKAWVAFASTGLAVVLAVWLVGSLAGVDWKMAWDYAWRLPRAEGQLKLRYIGTAAKFAKRVNSTVFGANLLALIAGYATPVLALVALAGASFGRGRREKWMRAAGTWALAAGVVWICLLFTVFAGNQWQNGVPFVFVGLGLLHAGFGALVVDGGTWARKFVSTIGLAAILITVRDAWIFEQHVNRTRVVNDIVFSEDVAEGAEPLLPPELAFLAWNLPASFPIAPGDFADLVRFLRDSPGGFMLVGDLGILPALAGKEALEPCVWIHPGLTMPWPDDPAFAAFDARWAAPFEDGRARWLVLQGEATYTRRRLEDFPALAKLAAERGRLARTFGPFRVLDLGSP
ncbi:MAG: hypothetical protein K8S98_14790 [Planctomycetes bacterium]|nr:hypothetical protein [Planctomycetota bacterium]